MLVVKYVSMIKDNENVNGFKEREKTFLFDEDKKYFNELYLDFYEFVRLGVKNETSRLYISANKVDTEKTYKKLKSVLNSEIVELDKINDKLIDLALENTLTRDWVIDFNSKDVDLLNFFLKQVFIVCEKYHQKQSKFKRGKATPNGFHIILDKGFKFEDKLFDDFRDFVQVKKKDFCFELKSENIYH